MSNELEPFLKKLEGLGLSSNEAVIYVKLLEKSPLTGYELAKRCSISRGSIYTTLERLVEKRAVQKTIDNKYIAVGFQQFLDIQLNSFTSSMDYLRNHHRALSFPENYDTVLFIYGHDNIMKKIKEMISNASKEVSVVGFKEELEDLHDVLVHARKRGVKIHAISLGQVNLDAMDVVPHNIIEWVLRKVKGRFLNVVVDIEEGLNGALDDTDRCVASWSKNRHFCTNIHMYISHEMTLLKVFNLLNKTTLSKIRSRLKKDDLVMHTLEGMPHFDHNQ